MENKKAFGHALAIFTIFTGPHSTATKTPYLLRWEMNCVLYLT